MKNERSQLASDDDNGYQEHAQFLQKLYNPVDVGI
jgi:hypothetical protein